MEQNPRVEGMRNPDYRIEERVFDNYAPTTKDARQIVEGINTKVGSAQADRIVLNLQDTPVKLHQVRQALNDNGSKNFKEIIVIAKDGSISRYP